MPINFIDKISGGMNRRAVTARALIHGPKLLFLDEPTVGLDAQMIDGDVHSSNAKGDNAAADVSSGTTAGVSLSNYWGVAEAFKDAAFVAHGFDTMGYFQDRSYVLTKSWNTQTLSAVQWMPGVLRGTEALWL